MHLDLPTLMTMESFVAVSAGAVLLIAWTQHRGVAALGLWGLADLIAAAGIFCLMLGWDLHEPPLTGLGGGLLALGSGFMWMAARAFDAKGPPPVQALLGVGIFTMGNVIPAVREFAGSLNLLIVSTYFLAIMRSLWLGRHEHLSARWPFLALIGIHVTVLLIGTVSTLNGSSSQDQVPPLFSLFGFIHFESIIFAIGTAVFMLALVKERSETASRRAAQIDALTGVANRASFTESATRMLERCRREGTPASVMMFDLDKFKIVNDRYGHAVGDAVLREFCKLAVGALRQTDVFGRIGGEEFAAVLPGTSIEAAFVRAERIRAAFAAATLEIEGSLIHVTVSCGLASNEDGKHELNALLHDADEALYCAKVEGRNRVRRAARPQPLDERAAVIRVA